MYLAMTPFAVIAREHGAKSVVYFQGIYQTFRNTCYLFLLSSFPLLAIALCHDILTR